MTKKLIAAMLVVLFSLFITSCSSQQSQNMQGKTVVVFWHAMGGPLGKTLKELVKRFNDTHPKIYVKLENVGNYSVLQQKIVASVQAGNPPDIAQAYESWTVNMAEGGRIVPLQQFIDEEKDFNLNDIFDVYIEDVTYKGKIQALPFNKSLPVLYWNKKLFKEAGLDPNKPPTTWEEFVEYAKKLTIDKDGDGKPDIYGTAFPPSSWYYAALVYQLGGKLFDTKTKQPMFNKEAGVKALQFLVDLIYKYKVAYLTTGFNHQTDFEAGKVAMILGSSVSKTFMEKKLAFPFGIAPIPHFKNGQKATVLSGTNLVIFNKGDNKKARMAWEFIKWLTSTNNTAYWAVKTFYLPVRKSALESDIMKALFKTHPGFKEVIKSLEYAKYEPFDPVWMTGRIFLGEALANALNTGKDVRKWLEEAAKKVAKEAERLSKTQH